MTRAKHPGASAGEPWWADTDAVTHVVVFRPVVRLHVAVAPGADPEATIASAVEAWTAVLSGAGEEGRVVDEPWVSGTAAELLVVEVEALRVSHSIEPMGDGE